ncbi:hypothetical protein M8C21_031316 [Ambrosia artemisiifolia]|uniref:Uncharacterized protein n=1 Tax=Ambrosia artemisiifolia TaxID=4212 RepID=A0AAD5GC59_AMBAR|nr:hypothetical protein M8C21_031316 [Ambrosia artemisiifolia]
MRIWYTGDDVAGVGRRGNRDCSGGAGRRTFTQNGKLLKSCHSCWWSDISVELKLTLYSVWIYVPDLRSGWGIHVVQEIYSM